MFVRVRLPIGEPHEALLIIDRAIQSDQGLKFVYVVDAQNKVQTRSIKTGALQEDGLRVVEGEIKPDDWVVVGAIQQVRAQMEVKPEQRPMPSLAWASRGPADGRRSERNSQPGRMPSRSFLPERTKVRRTREGPDIFQRCERATVLPGRKTHFGTA